MAGLLGMDVDAVRGVATRLDQQTDVLRQIIAAVDQLSGHATATWHGRDAQDFHGQWHAQHRPALQQTLGALAELSQTLTRNLAEQEHASGFGGALTPLALAATILTCDASARAGVWAGAAGHAGGHLDGLRSSLDLGAQAQVRAGAQADVSGQAQWGTLGVGALASGFAGARAGVNGHATLSAQGAKASVGGDAFAGVEATAQGTATFGDEGSATAGVSGYAGIGVNAHASAAATFDKIGADIELGAALGLGGEVHLDLSVSPKVILDDFTPPASPLLTSAPTADYHEV
jgi:uncharacterized protein YukE